MKQQERSRECASSGLTVFLVLFLIKRLSIEFTKCVPPKTFFVPLQTHCSGAGPRISDTVVLRDDAYQSRDIKNDINNFPYSVMLQHLL